VGATAIPLSGRRGDNVAHGSRHMPWYAGPTLIGHLEQVEPDPDPGRTQPFAMPVQWVNRSAPGFRGLAGTIARGAVRPGDRVRLLPSGSTTAIARIVTFDGDLDQAGQGEAVTLTLADEVECGRGEVICAAGEPLEVSDQFEATLVWMAEEPMLPGRSYWLRLGCTTVAASVTTLKHEVGLATLEKMAARSLAMNAIGVVNLALDRPVPFAPYAENRDLGGFLLIDRTTERTLGAGMIRFALRRSHNLHWQAVEVTPTVHAAQKGQRPRLLWFTGLSGAGKSTIANLVEKRLLALGRHSFLLDGDNLRHGLNRDLGFTDADRAENIRRVGEVAKLMTEAGLIVLAAFISPFRAERDMVRRMLPEGDFLEIHVDTPLEEAERRDAKGLYRKARAGLIRNFTGIDSPYEPPLAPEVRIDTATTSAEAAAERIAALCLAREGD
jgi:bifunctional enzyme CysN/CysC